MRDQTGTKRVVCVTGDLNRVVAVQMLPALASGEAGQRDGVRPVPTASDDAA